MFSKTIQKGVVFLLKKYGYTLVREEPGICADCGIAITQFVVKKPKEEELEVDMCYKCLQKAMNVKPEDVEKAGKGLI